VTAEEVGVGSVVGVAVSEGILVSVDVSEGVSIQVAAGVSETRIKVGVGVLGAHGGT
jgi:hypothetical protein